MTMAEQIYRELSAVGVEVVLDDREERSGVKFKDADLIGYPLRITVGPKALKENCVELKVRRTKESLLLPLDGYVDGVTRLLASL